jgi:hypothetical protein
LAGLEAQLYAKLKDAPEDGIITLQFDIAVGDTHLKYSEDFRASELLNSKPHLEYPRPEKQYLSVKELGQVLGKSEATIRRWAEREHEPIPTIKVLCNKQYTWSFDKDDALEWFKLFEQR